MGHYSRPRLHPEESRRTNGMSGQEGLPITIAEQATTEARGRHQEEAKGSREADPDDRDELQVIDSFIRYSVGIMNILMYSEG